MRTTALTPFRFTAEYWDFTETINPDNNSTILTYAYSREVKVFMTEQDGQSVVYTNEPLRRDAELRNVRDSSGRAVALVNNQTTAYFIGTPNPVFNVFGQIEGYRHLISINYADLV